MFNGCFQNQDVGRKNNETGIVDFVHETKQIMFLPEAADYILSGT